MKKARAPSPVRRSYAGRSIDDLKIERRERLMTAGFAILGSDGYQQLSIERVCARARVATRHYYEHYQGREALLHALFDRIENEVWQRVTKALTEPGGDLEQRTGNAICALVNHALSDPRRARIMCLESVGVSAELEARRRRLHRRFAELIHQVATQLATLGVLASADYRMSGMALVGATNELLVEWLSGDTGLSVAEMEQQVLVFFRTMIRGAKSMHQERQDPESRPRPANAVPRARSRKENPRS